MRNNDSILQVRFSIAIEPANNSGPDAPAIVQSIQGDIGLVDGPERTSIGYINAYLINMEAASGQVFDVYDCIDDEVHRSFASFFDFDEEDFRPEVYEAVEMDGGAEFHLHAHTMEIDPRHRKNGYGLQALRALRLLVRRPYLLATAHATPIRNPKTAGDHPKATAADIARLARYYASDGTLGFRIFGRPEEGRLVAKWE